MKFLNADKSILWRADIAGRLFIAHAHIVHISPRLRPLLSALQSVCDTDVGQQLRSLYIMPVCVCECVCLCVCVGVCPWHIISLFNLDIPSVLVGCLAGRGFWKFQLFLRSMPLYRALNDQLTKTFIVYIHYNGYIFFNLFRIWPPTVSNSLIYNYSS